MTDIDIDFADPGAALHGLRHLPAIINKNGIRQKHNSSVYFQDIPADPLDGMAAFDTETAADLGYFKLDFLSLSLYRDVRDEAHLVELLTCEPPWESLDDPDIVAALAHIRDHFEVVHKIKPRCIEDLAVILALIRPGKRHLLNQPRAMIDREIWSRTDKFYFKRAHAISYAASIVVQLNLLLEKA